MTLEEFGKTEVMRHVPPIEFLLKKVDVDARRRISLLVEVHGRFSDDERAKALEEKLRQTCKWLDRIAELARSQHRQVPAESPVKNCLEQSLESAVSALSAIDPARFRYRTPFQRFETSRAELMNEAVLAVISHLAEALALALPLDADLTSKILEPATAIDQTTTAPMTNLVSQA